MNYRTQAIHNMAIGLWDEEEARNYIATKSMLETTETMHKWLGEQEVHDVDGQSLIGESDWVDYQAGGLYDYQ